MTRKRKSRKQTSNNSSTGTKSTSYDLSTVSSIGNITEGVDEEQQVLLDGIDGLKRMLLNSEQQMRLKFMKIFNTCHAFLNRPVHTYEDFVGILEEIENETSEVSSANSSDKTITPKSVFENNQDCKTVRKRRSHSLSNETLTSTSTQKRRSKSTNSAIFKTPQNSKFAHRLLTAKKCTVIKKKKEPELSCLQVQRVLKPDEEAISYSGSPLYTPHLIITKPELSIPLPGGLVVKINGDQHCNDVPEISVGSEVFVQLQAITANLEKIIKK